MAGPRRGKRTHKEARAPRWGGSDRRAIRDPDHRPTCVSANCAYRSENDTRSARRASSRCPRSWTPHSSRHSSRSNVPSFNPGAATGASAAGEEAAPRPRSPVSLGVSLGDTDSVIAATRAAPRGPRTAATGAWPYSSGRDQGGRYIVVSRGIECQSDGCVLAAPVRNFVTFLRGPLCRCIVASARPAVRSAAMRSDAPAAHSEPK